ILLPPPVPSYEFRTRRSPAEQYQAVVSELINFSGLQIPPQAQAAYQDFEWETLALRLYVVTWELVPPDWTMLVILGTQPEGALPQGIQICLRDADHILEAPILTDPSKAYLYAQVIGTPREQFWVTLNLPDGAMKTFPAFTFE
ncbi:MAG TPA: hypothetical protein V6C57_18405, partial [Coleofasciculaceae cyanobacterium]